MKKKIQFVMTGIAAALLVVGCASAPSVAELNELTHKIVKASFRDEGFVKVDRVLNTDETNRACSEADVAGKPLDEKTAKAIEEMNLKAIKWPSDGKFIGDWKQGEAIAQSGRGLTWTDKATDVNGGNCYNCHQISKEELSYGTLGPSLYNYGKIRSALEPNSPVTKAITEYTWGKIQNARAYNACSNMPRFAHKGILTEAQIKHVMALLLDPASPVNK